MALAYSILTSGRRLMSQRCKITILSLQDPEFPRLIVYDATGLLPSRYWEAKLREMRDNEL